MRLVLHLDRKEDYQMYFIHFQTLFFFGLSQQFAQHKIRNVGKTCRQNVLYFCTFFDTPCAGRCFSKWCQHNGVGSDVSFSVQIHLGTSFQNEINKSKLYFSIWHDCSSVDAYSWNLHYQGYVRAFRLLRGHEDVKIFFLKNVLILSAWVLDASGTSSRSERRLPNVFHSFSNFIFFWT